MAYTTIDDPSAYFQTALWTGNGGTQSITNDGNSDLQPDWVWTKRRDTDGQNHHVVDSTRGVTKTLVPNDVDTEATKSTGLTAFNSDGFSIGADENYNNNTQTYVGWQWKANGGTTTTNDASSTGVGTIDSVNQANTTAGFSIITYTGTNAAGTIAHGLSAVPNWIITKNRVSANSWAVYHSANTSAPETDFLLLNTNAATVDNANRWNDVAPTSTVFSVKQSAETNNSDNSDTFVAYCFTEIQGYSKFGRHTGNGDADGPFIYTGFKPAWVMIKETAATGSWHMFDNKRKAFNPSDSILYADLSNQEATSQTGNPIDILSNGFKCRGGGNDTNLDGGTYVYMAFAEHPFVSSKGVPVTAK